MRRRVVGAAVALVVLVAVWLGWSHHVTSTKLDDVGSGSTPTGAHIAGPVAVAAVMPRHKGGLRIEGQVIDDHDQPVEGAVIKTSRTDPDNSERAQYAEDVVTASDGTFVVQDLVPDYYYVGATQGDDLFTEVAGFRLTAMAEPVILHMRAGVSAIVHVIDADSRAAIQGVSIVAHAWESFDDETTTRRSGTSDAKGVVHIHGLGAGWRLKVEPVSTTYELIDKSIELDTNPNGANELTLALSKGAAVNGTVRDERGDLVPEAVVYVEGHQTDQFTRTDANGRWHFDALARGPHLFSAFTAPRLYVRTTVELDGVTIRNVDLVIPAPVDGRAREAIVGIVVDESGSPVAKAEVIAHSGTDNSSGYVETDAAGRFRLEVSPGAARIFAAKDGRASRESELTVSERRGDLRLEIRPTSIEGTVVDHRGTPVARAEVRGTRSEYHPLSDEHGHFVLEGMVQSEQSLTAIGPDLVGYSNRMGTSRDMLEWVSARPGDRHVKLVVPESFAISGRVELAGSPVTSFGVSARQNGREPSGDSAYAKVVRSLDGRFTIPALPVGTWDLTFAGTGFQSKVVDLVHIDHKDIDIGVVTVDAGQRVRGRVADSRGVAIAGARVAVQTWDYGSTESAMSRSLEGLTSTRTDASGEFELVGFTPDPGNRIVASHPAYGNSVPYKIDDHTTHVDITIANTGALEGMVDKPDAYSSVVITRADDLAYQRYVRIDRVQHYVADGLPAGLYIIAVDSPSIPKRITIAAGSVRIWTSLVPSS